MPSYDNTDTLERPDNSEAAKSAADNEMNTETAVNARRPLSWASIAQQGDEPEVAPEPQDDSSEAAAPEPAEVSVEEEAPEAVISESPAEPEAALDAPAEVEVTPETTEAESPVAQEEPAAEPELSEPDAQVQRIDDSQLPDPEPSIMQHVRPVSGSGGSRRRRNRPAASQSPAGAPPAGHPGVVEDLTAFQEKVSGKLAYHKPEPRPERKSAQPAVEDFGGDDAADKPQGRRRRRKPQTDAENTGEAFKTPAKDWKPKARPEAAKAQPKGFWAKVAAFLGKLFGGDTVEPTATEKPAARQPAERRQPGNKPRNGQGRGPRANNGSRGGRGRGQGNAGPRNPRADQDAPEGGNKKRRRGRRGGRSRNRSAEGGGDDKSQTNRAE